jgi:hypothetical protein
LFPITISNHCSMIKTMGMLMTVEVVVVDEEEKVYGDLPI